MNTNQSTIHEALQADLKAYLDNELNPWRRFQVRRHLTGCADCRAEVQDMTRISQQLQAANEPPAGEAAFDAGLRARILSDAPAADRTFETAAKSPMRKLRLSRTDVFALGTISLVLFAIVYPVTHRARENARRSSGLVRSQQMPYNAANNALTAGEGDYAGPTAGSAPAAAPQEAEALRSAGEPRNQLDAVAKARSGNRFTDKVIAGPVTPSDAMRRVHKEASIGVAVKSAEDASDAVVKIVQGAGGFIAGNSLTSSGDDSKNAAMEIRVPVTKFDSVLDQIGDLGDVKSKNVSGEDLTEKFSNADQARRILVEDLSMKEAQLRAAKERAERKKKTYVPGWEERMELRNLRIQAAQAKARLELLRKTTDLSNISVQLHEQATPPGEAGFWQSLNETKMEAAKSFVAAARIPVQCLIWILAYSPLWLPALLAWRYFNRSPRNVA